MKMAEVMDHNVRRRSAGLPRKGDPEVKEMTIRAAENGGHVAEHEGGEHAFGKPESSVALPEGHVLTHIAKHMSIPHTVTMADRGLGQDKEADESIHATED